MWGPALFAQVPHAAVLAPTIKADTTVLPPGEIGIIRAGMTVKGRLEAGDHLMTDSTYADIWQFQATQGQQVTIELRSEEFDTYVQLLDASDNQLADDDDSLGDLNSVIRYTIPAAGTYQIVVTNYGDDRRAGLYSLTLR